MSDEKSQELEKDTSPEIDNEVIAAWLALYVKGELKSLICEVAQQNNYKISPRGLDTLAVLVARRITTDREDICTLVRNSMKGVPCPPKYPYTLDKGVRNIVETIRSMGSECGRIVREILQVSPQKEVKESIREELAQRFTYKDEKEIHPGVIPLQLNFLHDAALVGAFERLKPMTAKTIEEYFTTDKFAKDIAKEENVTDEAIRKRIISGIGKLHKILYKSNPSLQQEDPYPLEQIQKGKDLGEIARSEKGLQSRKEAGKKGAEYGHLGAEYGHLGAEYGHLGAEYGKLGGRPRKIDVFKAKPRSSQ